MKKKTVKHGRAWGQWWDAPICGQSSGYTVGKRYVTCRKCLKVIAKQRRTEN